MGDDEVLRLQVRIFLKFVDKNGDRLPHEGREAYASRQSMDPLSRIFVDCCRVFCHHCFSFPIQLLYRNRTLPCRKLMISDGAVHLKNENSDYLVNSVAFRTTAVATDRFSREPVKSGPLG